MNKETKQVWVCSDEECHSSYDTYRDAANCHNTLPNKETQVTTTNLIDLLDQIKPG